MDINELAQKHILNQPLYVTGKPIAYTAREFGLDPKDIDKLASNENPFGPSPKGMEEARKALEEVNLYPDGGSYDLIGKIAEFRGVKREQIAVGNGSNELLDIIRCNHFIIPTNGEVHSHPDRTALAHILCHPGRDLNEKVHLYFNCGLDEIVKNAGAFLKEGEQEAWNFEIHENATELFGLTEAPVPDTPAQRPSRKNYWIWAAAAVVLLIVLLTILL